MENKQNDSRMYQQTMKRRRRQYLLPCRGKFLALAWVIMMTGTSLTLSLAEALSSSSSASSTFKKNNNCAVIGVGVLGTSLCRQILEAPEFSDATVTGITRTSDRHDAIRSDVGWPLTDDRFRLVRSEDFLRLEGQKFGNVVFCAPPSGFDDYAAAVKEATEKYWAGPEAGGVFVFTSSGAVYGPGDSSTVTEASPIADVDNNPRVARLVNAEQFALKAGGCCLRLAGLYNLQRGAHNFWLTSEKPVQASRDGLINLLHYDDAAAACLAALKAGPEVCNGRAFLISDANPLSRMQICQSALKAAVYSDCSLPQFAETEPQLLALGKVYDGTASNRALRWKPQYESFDAFMESNA